MSWFMNPASIIVLVLWICYTSLSRGCPCATAANEPSCVIPVFIQRFVQDALKTVIAPPVLALAWITNKAELPNDPLFKILQWLEYSHCEPDKWISMRPSQKSLHSRSQYVWHYWGENFPATRRCWYRLSVSNEPVWLPEDDKETLWCDQLVLIKRAVCTVTGCVV